MLKTTFILSFPFVPLAFSLSLSHSSKFSLLLLQLFSFLFFFSIHPLPPFIGSLPSLVIRIQRPFPPLLFPDQPLLPFSLPPPLSSSSSFFNSTMIPFSLQGTILFFFRALLVYCGGSLSPNSEIPKDISLTIFFQLFSLTEILFSNF